MPKRQRKRKSVMRWLINRPMEGQRMRNRFLALTNRKCNPTQPAGYLVFLFGVCVCVCVCVCVPSISFYSHSFRWVMNRLPNSVKVQQALLGPLLGFPVSFLWFYLFFLSVPGYTKPTTRFYWVSASDAFLLPIYLVLPSFYLFLISIRFYKAQYWILLGFSLGRFLDTILPSFT